jgi:hypothetical protein
MDRTLIVWGKPGPQNVLRRINNKEKTMISIFNTILKHDRCLKQNQMKQALKKKFDLIKNISFLILMLGFFSACTVNNTGENIASIEKYVSAVESKDYSTMEALLADNYKGYGPSHSDSTDKIDALAAWKYNIENLYDSISYERSQVVGVTIPSGSNKGNWVTNWAELKITYKDGSGPVTIWANSNYKIENGKIVKSYTVYNEADVLKQLGYGYIHKDEL